MSDTEKKGFTGADIAQMVRLGLILSAFAVAMSFLLALVNNVTAPAIARNAAAKTNAAMRAVFPEAGLEFVSVTDFTPPDSRSVSISEMYIVKRGSEVIGAVTRVSGATYDRSTLLVGQDLNMNIAGVEVLETTDSPGFGQKMMDTNYTVSTGQTFPGQFAGKNAAKGFTVGSNFEAISGATISSRGVGNILTLATYSAGQYLARNYGGSGVDVSSSASGGGPNIVEDVYETFSYENALSDIANAAGLGDVTFTELFPENGVEHISNMTVEKLYAVYSGSKLVAAAVSVSGQTYHDGGTVLTMVDGDNKILGARIIALGDSPNIGMRTTGASFYKQFDGLPADKNILNGEAYEALSGATISSDCIADMVKVSGVRAIFIMLANGSATLPTGQDLYSYKLNENYLEE